MRTRGCLCIASGRVEKQVLADWTLVNGERYAPGTAVYIPSIWVREADDVQTLK